MGYQQKTIQWLFGLVLVLTVVLTIGCLPAFFTDPVPTKLLTIVYGTAAYVSQNFLFSLLFGVLLLPVYLFVETDRNRLFLTLIPLVVFLLFFMISSKVFAFWRFYVNAPIFHLFFAKGGRSNVFQISQEMYVFLILAGIFFILLSLFVIYLARKVARWLPAKIIVPVFFFMYVAVQGVTLFFVRNQDTQFLQYLFKSPYFMTLSWANILDRMGVPVFPKNALSSELRTVLSQSKKMHYPIHPLQFHQAKKLNVLLIVVDSLRFDMINPINMPNIYQFAQKSDQFSNHISGGDCTRAGIFSLFYGIPANYWDSAIANHQGSIVIKAFQKNGYQMKLLGSAGFLSPPFNRTVFSSVKNLTLSVPGGTPWQRDQVITQNINTFLDHQKNKKRPFFGFLFYDSPHAYNALDFQKPFVPSRPINYFTVNNNTNPLPIFNLYKNAVFAVDKRIAAVLRHVKSDGLQKNTVIIVTSDHGQEFNEYHNNYWEHPSGFSKYQLRTPFLIAWPGRVPNTYSYLTTHFDLAPTLLKHILGVSNRDSDYSVGHDLYQPHTVGQAVIGRYGYFGLVTKNFVMPFQDNGLYRFTNKKMNPIAKRYLDDRARRGMLQQMWQFY